MGLFGVQTGNFFAEVRSRHPIYTRFSEDRISSERSDVDVYVWMDEAGSVPRICNTLSRERSDRVASYLPIDLGAVRMLNF